MEPSRFDRARDALRQYYGFSDLRDGQARAIRSILAGRDSLVVLPTGGGKSLCYQLPALVLPGLTVVVSPLIALMDDQVQGLRRRRIAAAALHSGLKPSEEAHTWRSVESGVLQLMYLSPERLLSPRTLARLTGRRIAIFAVDEAHCVCEWGYDFRPDYLRLAAARDKLAPFATMALTATATPATRRDIVRVLELRQPIVVVSGFDRPNLYFGVERVGPLRDRITRIRDLVRSAAPDPVIVYAGTRTSVEAVARSLAHPNGAVDFYHAGRTANDRTSVQERFASGSLRVLVATNAFGMGVDKPDVRLVVHLAPPGSIEDYYQEAGRASRDGAPGRCLLLAGDDDRELHERFLKRSYPPEARILAFWERLVALAGNDDHVILDPPGQQGSGLHRLTPSDSDVLAILSRHGLVSFALAPPEAWRVRLLVSHAHAASCPLPLSVDASRLMQRLLKIGTPPRGDDVPLAGLLTTLTPRQAAAAVGELTRQRLLNLAPPSTHVRFLVSADARSGGRLPIDWSLRRTRAGMERARLDAMQGYVGTRRCRRRFLLRYFGQHPAPLACGDCDNCTMVGSGLHGRLAVFLRAAFRGARNDSRLRAR